MHSVLRKDMWLAMLPDDGQPGDAYIQYEFDMPYKLNDMKIWNYNEEDPLNGYGAKDINILYSLDGENWTQLGDTVTLEMAPGDNTCTANAPIDMQGVAAKYVKISFLSSFSEGDQIYGISEVQFSTIPTYATLFTPADNAANQSLDTVMTWKTGRDAAEHSVYYSTDPNDLGSANTVSGDTTFAPTDLQLNQTYYWRVDEVNEAEAYPVWEGPVLSFTTSSSVLIDGFETYGSTEEDYIWAVWKDGVEISANGGSEIGKDIVPATGRVPGLSTTLVHSGTYALPVDYDNTGANSFSQVSAQSVDLPIGTTDWSKGSPKSLVIWFMGEPNNTPSQLYIKLNNTKVVYDGKPAYLSQSVWRQWAIDLSQVNVDLGNITSITIGLENTGNQSGKGTLLLDDIALSGVEAEVVEAVDPGTTGLIAYYAMENNVQDSSGNNHNGTIVGAPTYVQGPAGYGMAMQFNPNADSNDFVDLGKSDPNVGFNPAGSFSVSLWAKITTWSDGWGDVMIGNRGESGIGWQLRKIL